MPKRRGSVPRAGLRRVAAEPRLLVRIASARANIEDYGAIPPLSGPRRSRRRTSGKDKTSLILATRNTPGAIHQLLTPLAANGVSMTKLESRPARTGLWEYVFYVDIEGHAQNENVARALFELERTASLFKNLGSYPSAA